MARYKLKLNSIEKIEELLQIMYDEANQNIVKLQEEINKITTSTNLNQCSVDEKAKFAKAINDYIANKDKAIGRKIEIAKLMTEVHKYSGNVGAAVQGASNVVDWEHLKDALYEQETTDETKEYHVAPKSKK